MRPRIAAVLRRIAFKISPPRSISVDVGLTGETVARIIESVRAELLPPACASDHDYRSMRS